MSYLQSLRRILVLDPAIHRELAESGRLFKTTFLNLVTLGIFFGAAYIYDATELLRVEQPGGFENSTVAAIVFVMLIVAATAQIFLAHAGFSLLLWAMSRGLKGTSTFFPVYLHTGASVVPLWLGFPMAFLYSAGYFGFLPLILAAVSLTWGAATMIQSVVYSQQLTFVRSTIALIVTIVFIISFRIITS